MDSEDVLTGLQAAAAHYSVSLDAPSPGRSDDTETTTLGDELGAEDDRFAAVATCLAFSAEARRLPTAERHALALRLKGGLKQSEIAVRLGCSQIQVSRLLRSAAGKLRDSAG